MECEVALHILLRVKKTNIINLLKHEKMHNITFLYCGTLSIVLQATGQKPDIALFISHSSMST